MTNRPSLFLASASPRRRELLSRLGVPFEVITADIDEARHADESPLAMTERLAQSKARTVAELLNEPCWVIGADTTVALGDRVFGKPSSRHDAIDTLNQLADNTHEVISSVALLGPGSEAVRSVVSRVTFGPLSARQIEIYCNSDEPWDKAGSYGIQGLAGAFVEHIDGDYTAIVGLPLFTCAQLLRAAGLIAE